MTGRIGAERRRPLEDPDLVGQHMPPVRRLGVRFGAQPRPGLRKLEERVADLAALKALGQECAHEGARLHRHAPDCDAQRSYAVRQVPVASAGYLVVHPATTRAIG
ncbi:MAG TPA: hypothetical protein VIK31_04575, partial [Propionibacteriaceae bacterium]